MNITENGFIVVKNGASGGLRDSYFHPFGNIKEAFKAARSNDRILIYPGSYLGTPALPIQSYNMPDCGAVGFLFNLENVTIQGFGRPRLKLTCHGTGIDIRNCKRLTIKGIDIEGQGIINDKTLPYYFALIQLDGINENLLFEDVGIYKGGNHGLAHCYGPRSSTYVTVKNCRFVEGGHMANPGLGRDGCAIGIGSDNVKIIDCHIEKWLRGVEIEPGSFGSRDIPINHYLVKNCDFRQCWWQSIVVIVTHCKTNLFNGIKIHNNSMRGWGEAPQPNWNSVFYHGGISFQGGTNFSIRENEITDMWQGIGIQVTSEWGEIAGGEICDNQVRNCGKTGIHCTHTVSGTTDFPVRNIRIKNNEISQVGGRGIWLRAIDSIVENNQIRDTGSYEGTHYEGIFVEDSPNVINRNNVMYRCGPSKYGGESNIEFK